MTATAPEPTWGYLARRGVSQLAAEGVAPIAVFYAVWRVSGLAVAIVVATAISAGIVVWQAGRGRQGQLARLTLVFLAVQAVVGLTSHSATVYLAQPVVLSAAWGAAYLVSALVGRPLIALFAEAWYPFPPAFRRSDAFRREFTLQSLVWGVFCLLRAAVRLLVLLRSGPGGFVVVSILTGTPVFFGLVAWRVWHARRAFSRLEASAGIA